MRSEDTTRRRRAFVLVVVVSLPLWPGRAWADEPERTPVTPGEDFISDAACPFRVLIHPVTNNQYDITFFDRTITQGHLVLEITNLDTRVSVIRNASGPGTITAADHILVARGPWFFSFEPGELADEPDGSMFINNGRIVLLLGDPSAGIPHDILSQTGVRENLCVTLGASPDGEPSAAETREASEAEVSESQVPPLDSPELPPVKFL